MNAPVARPYDASRRRQAAARSKSRILEAAKEQFTVHGYAATTVASIATAADVSAQLVTKYFHNKPGLVQALFQTALLNDDAPTPLSERTWIQAIHEQPNPVEKLRLFAAVLGDILPRTAPIQLLMREAATDAAVKDVWARIRTGRLMGMTDLAKNLAAGNHLRPGITIEHARDVLWTYSSVELYELFVLERGHSLADYTGLIATGTTSALLSAT